MFSRPVVRFGAFEASPACCSWRTCFGAWVASSAVSAGELQNNSVQLLKIASEIRNRFEKDIKREVTGRIAKNGALKRERIMCTYFTVRYLGLYIDKRVTWNPHTRLKRIDLNRKFGLLRNLLHRRSKLSLVNKLTIYNMILKPTWTYGIELWGSARKSNIDRIQSFQSKTLRTILDAPCSKHLSLFHERKADASQHDGEVKSPPPPAV
ncbi:hypothetical protein AAG570_000612 [Ranatra chinensis]|uniref:Uncharacterized protein n=1 Tax=Ranatra chinensis TaxID=642074 RepID=A0ABD0Z7Y1_9HEMI